MIMMFLLICVSCKSAPAAPPVTQPTPATAAAAPPASQPALVTLPVSGSVSATPPASGLAPVTPPATETAPAPQTGRLAQASVDGLTTPITRAEDSRKRAVDFESPDYFPSDWEAVEALYTAAANMPVSTNAEIQQAAAAYNAAADAYDELFRKTAPLYAQAREDEVMAARDELIGTGFTEYIPEHLQSADEIALAALAQYEAGDYYEARDTAAKALDEYETLLIGARIFLIRQEILDRGFDKYDPVNFDKADEVTLAVIDDYEAGNRETAIANAEEVRLRYNVLLSNGWTAYAADRKKSVLLERELALAERANIAARDIFRDAEAIFNQAEEIFASENFQDAAIMYTDAEAIYVIARHETEEKRRRALETIRLAEEKIGESNEAAAEAERIIEGGSR